MKQRKTFVLLTAACLAAFTFIACSKSDKKDDGPQTPQEQPGKIPGLGEAPGTPEGTALTYPAGVTLASTKIYGQVCDTAYEVGTGGVVEVCVALANNNATDVTFTLPAGLVILADDLSYQHGLLIQNFNVVLKAKRTTRVGIKLLCLNAERRPSSSDKTYKIGPVTSSPLIRQLCENLKNKKVARKEFADEDQYFMVATSLQGLVWAYTDGDGYDATMLARLLAEIPNK
ncbi:hypothetical protein WJU16_20455 [Chitinophaga pollutisoli]|uniref:Uncharacterized protein n=1 Tax=Chitinophaga pollutisoli TaxID=3133966 RepID=A0ABZ2YM26_9BACT